MAQNGSMRKIRYLLWSLVALAAAAAVWFMVISPRLQTLGDAGTTNLGHGDYRLAATDGTEFTQASLKGQPTAVFFGFTNCPDVCPTTLGEVAGWQEELAKEGLDLKVFFVTVDPERDSVEVLKEYVSWAPGVVGVSGSPEELAKAIKAFRVYARKVPSEKGYTMDHSAMTLLFDAKGNYSGLIGYQEDPARAKASLDKLIGS